MNVAEIRTWKKSAITALRKQMRHSERAALLTAVVAIWEIAEQLALRNLPERKRK